MLICVCIASVRRKLVMSSEELKSIRREKDRLRKSNKASSLNPDERKILKIKNAESHKKCRKRRADIDPHKAISIKQGDKERKKAAAKTIQNAVNQGDEGAIEQQKKRKKQKQMSDQYLKRRIKPSLLKEAGVLPCTVGSERDVKAALRRSPTDAFRDANYKPGYFKTASWMQMQQAYNRIGWDQMSASLNKLHPLLIRRDCKFLPHVSKDPCKKEAYYSWRKQFDDVCRSISDDDAFANHEAFQEMLTKLGVSDTHKYMREVQLLPFNYPVLSTERTSTNLSTMWTEGIPDMFCNEHKQKRCCFKLSLPNWYSNEKPELTHNDANI